MKADRAEALLGPGTILAIAAVLAGAALAILWLGWHTDVDLWLADRAFDSSRMAFPWRDAWLADNFNHGMLKAAFTALGVTIIATVLVDLVRPMRRIGGRTRLRLRVVALSAALVPLATSLLKQSSNAHCPWDLSRYGGTQPYVRLFEALPAGATAGHCLPAGHASTSLWLIACAVFWLPQDARTAAGVAAAGMVVGTAMGWMQQLRGAHFLTHTLWSVWVAVLVVSVTTVLMDASARPYTPHTTS